MGSWARLSQNESVALGLPGLEPATTGFVIANPLLTHPNLLWGDAVVGVGDERVAWDGAGLPDLGGDEDADRAQELELRLEDATAGEEPVQQVHGQAEHLRLAVLLMNHL